MKKVLSRIKEKIKDILNFTKKHKKKVLIGLAVFIILFLPTFLYINLTYYLSSSATNINYIET